MRTIDLEALIELLEGDRELVQSLVEHGLIAADAVEFGPEEIELILVSRTLVRELEINWQGVDVILRMRQQLLMTRLRLAELLGKDK